MTYDELVENVAKIVVNNNLLKLPSRTTAKEIIGTIREVLQEPTMEMKDASVESDSMESIWNTILAASTLGEHSE